MSVQVNHITILGQKFSYEDFKKLPTETQDELRRDWEQYEFDKYHPSAPELNCLTMIFDGMNGEYIIFGFVLNATKAGDEMDMEFGAINPHEIPRLASDVAFHLGYEGILKTFGKEVADVKLYTFSHYS